MPTRRRFGCDELFERGFIAVNGDGRIEINQSKGALTAAVKVYLDQIENREAYAPGAPEAVYFEWHFAHHFVPSA